MRLLLILNLVAVVALSVAQEESIKTKELALVDAAIAEATKNYEAKLLLATINGAQSQKSRRFINKFTPETERIGKVYAILKEAKNIMINKHELSAKEAEILISPYRQSECAVPQPNCDPTDKYRSANGTCNNLSNPLRGSTYQPLSRQVAPDYFSGINEGDEPHGGLQSTLPNPRNISLTIHKGDDMNNTEVTHMVAQFGQFLDHDISLTPEGGKTCCDPNGRPVVDADIACWHIPVASDDQFYNDRTLCLDYTRSTPSCQVDTHREQMNIITAFIDGSNIYGSDEKLTKMLRRFKGGELVENSQIPGFLPWTSDVDPAVSESGVIIAGDRRANEMPALTVTHTLFMREHNRIAREFASHTNWTDEEIFQETKRIVGAELQQITYDEYLPVTLGPDAMTKYNLALGVSSLYDPAADPTIFNSFATGAYRFGHTLVNGLIFMMMDNTVQDSYHVRDHYFQPHKILNMTTNTMPGYEMILNGLIRQSAQMGDSVVSEDMTNYLFQTISNTFGSDLAARNIQRGRDHGLPGYNAFREHCNMAPLTDWNTPPAEIDEVTWDKLRLAYETNNNTVFDIDLYTGGLAQTPVTGGQAGPTFVCLMGLQFEKLKSGDRFFFTHVNQSGSFTTEQLAQLRKRTLGDIICENSHLTETGQHVFKKESPQNPMVRCDATSRQKLDIHLFAGHTDDEGGNGNNGSPGLQLSIWTFITLTLSYLAN